jgi:hypothetical protein
MLTEAGFTAIEHYFVQDLPQSPHYLAVAHKR